VNAGEASRTASQVKGTVDSQLKNLMQKASELFGTEEIEVQELADTSALLHKQLMKQINEILQKLQAEEENLRKKKQLEEELAAGEKRMAELQEELSDRKQELAAEETRCTELKKQAEELASSLPYTDRNEALQKKEELIGFIDSLRTELERAEQHYNECRTALTELKGRISQLENQLEQGDDCCAEKEEARKAELSREKEILQGQLQKARTRISTNETVRKNIKETSGQLEILEERWTWVKSLSNTANGNITGKEKVMLETYIQMTYFDRIILRANRRLMSMTGGQYELVRRQVAENNRSQSGLELDVIDHYNGSQRSVKTLSGGESFKASLSLALGLSDEVQSSAGGIRLDTMFVDEGFGSLDEESLQQAIRTLAGLSEGNRLVGIISHVGELKEKIDRQVLVTKEKSGGSRVEILVG